jgi:hypothetical protein
MQPAFNRESSRSQKGSVRKRRNPGRSFPLVHGSRRCTERARCCTPRRRNAIRRHHTAQSPSCTPLPRSDRRRRHRLRLSPWWRRLLRWRPSTRGSSVRRPSSRPFRRPRCQAHCRPRRPRPARRSRRRSRRSTRAHRLHRRPRPPDPSSRHCFRCLQSRRRRTRDCPCLRRLRKRSRPNRPPTRPAPLRASGDHVAWLAPPSQTQAIP